MGILLSNVGPVRYFVGKPVKASGFLGHTIGRQTLVMRLSNFKGRITIQATLEPEPQETDWFPVILDTNEFIEFPTIELPYLPGRTTGTFGYMFRGNYVWLRAIIDRRHFTEENFTETQLDAFGGVENIKVISG